MMKVLMDAYDKFLTSSSEGFLLRAVFPWIFVLFLNVVIYETLIYDGRSLVDRFARLPEHLHIYAALGVVAAVAAVAAISDGIADLFVSQYRLQRWETLSNGQENKKTRVFEVEFFRHATSTGVWPETAIPLLAEIDRAKTAVHRSVILAMGFAMSILFSTFELAYYQEDRETSIIVVLTLWGLMAVSLGLATRQITVLAALDDIFHHKIQPPTAAPPAAAPPGTSNQSVRVDI
jgi:hypothetical protein